jgi:hypothetical protein
MSYASDRQWADRYIEAAQKILRFAIPSHLLFPVAPDDLDRQKVTDLIIFSVGGTSIGFRVRRPGYAVQYPHQFTLRLARFNGMETEFSKMLAGMCRLYLYAHASEGAEGVIDQWMLLDVDELRTALAARRDYLIQHRGTAWGETINRDGATSFIWFNRLHLGPAVTLAHRTTLWTPGDM